MAISKIIKVDATPTITASSAYTAGNALGGKLTFTNLCDGGQSYLYMIRVIDLSNQKAATDVLLYDQSFTATTDKNAIAVSAADAANLIGFVSIAAGDWITIQTGRAVATKIIAYPMPLIAAADNTVYAQLVTRGTPTYGTTTDIVVRMYATPTRGDW